MLKLKLVQNSEHCNWYFDFVDEFNGKSWGGKTFSTLNDAVEFARENVVYKNMAFDLVSISKPEYTVEIR